MDVFVCVCGYTHLYVHKYTHKSMYMYIYTCISLMILCATNTVEVCLNILGFDLLEGSIRIWETMYIFLYYLAYRFFKWSSKNTKNMAEEMSVVNHGRPIRLRCHMCSFNPWVKLIRSLLLGVYEK